MKNSDAPNTTTPTKPAPTPPTVPTQYQTPPNALAQLLAQVTGSRTGPYNYVGCCGVAPQVLHVPGLWITWHAFLLPPGKKLPHYYVCELPVELTQNQNADIDLYNIGAVGNAHDVDLLITDLSGKNVLTGVLWENGQKASQIVKDIYQAAPAGWDPRKSGGSARGHCGTEMTLKLAQGQRAVIWAVSYRHGSREVPPFPKPGKTFVQDSDGSPGGGLPGGDAT